MRRGDKPSPIFASVSYLVDRPAGTVPTLPLNLYPIIDNNPAPDFDAGQIVTVHGRKTAFLCYCEAFGPKQSQIFAAQYCHACDDIKWPKFGILIRERLQEEQFRFSYDHLDHFEKQHYSIEVSFMLQAV